MAESRENAGDGLSEVPTLPHPWEGVLFGIALEREAMCLVLKRFDPSALGNRVVPPPRPQESSGVSCLQRKPSVVTKGSRLLPL